MRNLITTVGAIAIAAAAHGGDTTVVGFDNGAEGWEGPQGIGGATTIDTQDGAPAPSLRTVFSDFGITFRTTNPAWARDYSGASSVTFAVDTKVRNIDFFGTPVSRPWLIELRDFDSAQGGYPWASVWFKFTDISAANTADWTTFSVTIGDPQSADLPTGWRGYGDEDPNTFEPILPPGVTFADILASVDQVAYTTLEPGFFFGETAHDIAIDTVTVSVNSGGCNVADIADPLGVLDLADVQAFISAFVSGDDQADIAEPFGVLDLADVQAFIAAFLSGCT